MSNLYYKGILNKNNFNIKRPIYREETFSYTKVQIYINTIYCIWYKEEKFDVSEINNNYFIKFKLKCIINSSWINCVYFVRSDSMKIVSI